MEMDREFMETRDLQNVSYILEDSRLFQPTSYKVLKGQEGNGLLRCAHLLYNGNIKLIYFTAGKSSLKSLLPEMDSRLFLVVMASLLKVVLEIKGNGFLSCSNLELEADKIFIDTVTWSVSLIYLPVKSAQEAYELFERRFRQQLSKLISSQPMLRTERVEGVFTAVSDFSLSLDGLYRQVCKACELTEGSESRSGPPVEQPQMQILSTDPGSGVSIVIQKKEFVLGKNPAAVDGAITFNPAISRIHCRILWKNNTYYIEDMDSANGTYVNGSPIFPHQMWEIKDGDVIRLANSDFLVRTGVGET